MENAWRWALGAGNKGLDHQLLVPCPGCMWVSQHAWIQRNNQRPSLASYILGSITVGSTNPPAALRLASRHRRWQPLATTPPAAPLSSLLRVSTAAPRLRTARLVGGQPTPTAKSTATHTPSELLTGGQLQKRRRPPILVNFIDVPVPGTELPVS